MLPYALNFSNVINDDKIREEDTSKNSSNSKSNEKRSMVNKASATAVVRQRLRSASSWRRTYFADRVSSSTILTSWICEPPCLHHFPPPTTFASWLHTSGGCTWRYGGGTVAKTRRRKAARCFYMLRFWGDFIYLVGAEMFRSFLTSYSSILNKLSL